jgi:uncharacterized repeat protein (TIGR03803 family)
MDKNRNVYGTTMRGGGPCFHNTGCGTIFRIAPGGGHAVLHVLKRAQGYTPLSGVMKDKHGRFFGTTQNSYHETAYGTVFKFKP